MKTCIKSALLLASALALAGCASHLAPLGPDQTAVIPGRDTAGLSSSDATRTVLIEAARLTVDHGFQYFRIVGSQSRWTGYAIRPGANVTIKVFEADAVGPVTPGTYDAEKILAEGPPASAMASSPPPYSPSPNSPSQPQPQSLPPPRCTAYGCVW